MVTKRVSEVVAVTCLAIAGLLAAVATAAEETPEKYLELLRQDLKGSKVELLTEALDLTPAQADVFWPIYRQYDTELSALGDRRIALIKRFGASYGGMTDEQADEIAKEHFKIQRDWLKLREKYYKRVAKDVSPLIGARFIQVENAISTLIDVQIAAELPLLE